MSRQFEDPNFMFKVVGTEAMATCRHCKLEMKTSELDKPQEVPQMAEGVAGGRQRPNRRPTPVDCRAAAP